MDQKDYILSRLDEHIRGSYEPPTYYPKRKGAQMTFNQRSLSRWAANEFFSYLKGAPNLIVAAEIFVKKMDEYSCNKKNSWMFSIAHDVATDLLDYIYTL